jgi:hypothetical protein
VAGPVTGTGFVGGFTTVTGAEGGVCGPAHTVPKQNIIRLNVTGIAIICFIFAPPLKVFRYCQNLSG